MKPLKFDPLSIEDIKVLKNEKNAAGCIFPFIIAGFLLIPALITALHSKVKVSIQFADIVISNSFAFLLGLAFLIVGLLYNHYQKSGICKDLKEGTKVLIEGTIQAVQYQYGDGSSDIYKVKLEQQGKKFDITLDKIRALSNGNDTMREAKQYQEVEKQRLLNPPTQLKIEYGYHSGVVINVYILSTIQKNNSTTVMENKFFHKTDALRDSEKHGLKLQLKPEDNPSVFKEYFFLEQGLQDFHKIELFIGVAMVVYSAYIGDLIGGLFVVCLLLLIHCLEFYFEKRKRKAKNRHIASLLSKGQIFLIKGQITKTRYESCLIFEDKTVIKVFPHVLSALKSTDFVSIRYFKDIKTYTKDEDTYYSNEISELILFNKDCTASLEIDTSAGALFLNQYGEYGRRKDWEEKLKNKKASSHN